MNDTRNWTCVFRTISAFLLCLSASNVVFAQAADWTLEGSSFSASPSQLSAAAAHIKADKFAMVTVLYEEDKSVFDTQGRLTNSHRLIYRIETQDGVASWSEASVNWEPFYQNEPTIQARILRPDGSVVDLDQKTLTDIPAQNVSGGTYSDGRILKAPLPGLSIGAIVEMETRNTDKEPFFTSGGVYRSYFRRNVPVIRSRILVEVPSGVSLQYKTAFLPDSAVKFEELAGAHRLIVSVDHLDPSVSSDINLSTQFPYSPSVEFSTGTSWHSIANAYLQLAEPQILPDQIKSMLPSSLPHERMALIQTLVSSLHNEVRYTGIEFGKSKLQPQTPSEILKRHYGDCKDKASLLVAMLRADWYFCQFGLVECRTGERC